MLTLDYDSVEKHTRCWNPRNNPSARDPIIVKSPVNTIIESGRANARRADVAAAVSIVVE